MTKRRHTQLKVAAIVTALAMIGTAGIGSTLAYLTDSEMHTNTFTVGDVKIELEEESYGVLTQEVKTNIVPNQELAKDPKVVNSGVNDAIVFIKVTVPVKEVTLVADNGTTGSKQLQEIFYFKDANDTINIHENNFNGMWIRLDDEELSSNTSRTYVFGYKKALAGSADGNPHGAGISGSVTETLFDKVQLKNVLEDELLQGEIEKIKVEAFAIQANEIILENATEAYNASGTLRKADLEEIYEIFIRQGTKVSGNLNTLEKDSRVKEADLGNYAGLTGSMTMEYTNADPSREVVPSSPSESGDNS